MDVPESWQDSSLGRQLAGIYFRIERERGEVLSRMNMREFMQRQEEKDDALDEVLKGYDS